MKPAAVIFLCLVLGGCASGPSPRKVEDLVRLDDPQLVERLFAGTARHQDVRAALIEKHPEWSSSTLSYITSGKVMIGMDMFQAAAALGKPEDFHIFRGENGNQMLWIYGKPGYSEHIWLTNGFVSKVAN